MGFQDKTALVTGAGSGIGRSVARRLASAGARVGVLGHTAEDVEELAADLTQQGMSAIPLVADVADPEQMKAAVDKLTSKWQRLDLVVANAGVNGVWAPVDELTPEEWEQTLSVNLTGTFLTLKYAAPWLKRNGGSVVIVSSVNGTRNFSNSGASAYAVSKAGQVAFMKMIALELAPKKIRVNAVCPGAIETEIDDNTEERNLDDVRLSVDYPRGGIPLTDGKPGTADQVAELIAFLLSDGADHVTGTEVWIDGAGSLLRG